MSAERSLLDGRKLAPVQPPDCFGLLGQKWTAEIVAALLRRPGRFTAVHAAVSGVSDKVLSRRLAELERLGIVARTQFAEIPPRVEYELTPLGFSLRPVIGEMERWNLRYGGDLPAADLAHLGARGGRPGCDRHG